MTARTLIECNGCGQQINTSGRYLTLSLHQPYHLDGEQTVYHSHQDPSCARDMLRRLPSGITSTARTGTVPPGDVPTRDEINRH